MLWRALDVSSRANFKPQEPILGSMGPNLGQRGVPEKQSGRKNSFYFWEGAHSTSGPFLS